MTLRIVYLALGAAAGIALYLAFAPLPKVVTVGYCPAPVFA